MDIVNRIKSFMNHEGIGSSQFADTCLIARPTLSQILNGRNKKISDEIISKIHQAYPKLSVTWLLFGEGSMFVPQNIQLSEPQNGLKNSNSSEQHAENEPFPPLEAAKEKSSNFDANNLFDPTDFESLEDSADATETATQISIAPTQSAKKIVHIMIFYNDNTFESVTPA